MSELVDCINNLSAKDIIRAIAKTANGVPFYLQTMGGEFSPADIPNLVFWFDGQDDDTFTLNGAKVIQWNDKSGNGHHVSQAVDANRPTWSSVTKRLTFVLATQQNLRSGVFARNQPSTTIVAYKKLIAKDITAMIVGDIAATAFTIGTYTSGAGKFRALSGTTLALAAADLLDHVHTVVWNGVTSEYYLDLVAPVVGNVGALDSTGVEIGSYNNGTTYLDAELMEAIEYSEEISDANRLLLIAYLQDKWGI